MPIIGQASIQIRALDRFFEKDVKAAVKKIKNVGIELKVDADISKASKKIRDLRFRVGKQKPITIHFDANITKAEKQLENLFKRFANKDFEYEVKAHTKGASTQLEELHQRYGHKKVNMTAVPNTKLAETVFKMASRPRDVWFNYRVRKRSLAVMEGFVDILAGLLPMDKIARGFENLIANFSEISLKGNAVVAALGAISGAILALGGNALVIADDLAKLTGLLALTPALVGAVGASVAFSLVAWNNFGAAVQGDEEALAKLVPKAREAAEAFHGMGELIARPVQTRFWDGMGDSLQDLMLTLPTELAQWGAPLANTMGQITADVVDRVTEASRNGSVGKFLQELKKGFDALRDGVVPTVDAIGMLADVGAEYFGRFGEAIGEAGKDFGAFIENAYNNGDIFDWIDEGITQLKNLASITKSTVSVIDSLAAAAELGGSSGLDELADGMENLAKTVSTNQFIEGMATLVEGGREGTAALGRGFVEVTDLIGRSTDQIKSFLIVTGEIAGEVFSGIASMFEGTRLGGGLMSGLYSLREALQELEPGFANIGNIIGDLAEIAGGAIENMAPGLNIFLSTVETVVSTLKDGILAVQPILNEFVQAILTAAHGPIEAFATAIGNILEAFAEMPKAMQLPIAAFAAFLVFKARIVKMFVAIRTASLRAFSGMARDAMLGQGNMGKMATSLGRLRTSMATTGAAVGRMKTQMALGGAAARLKSDLSSAGGAARDMQRNMSMRGMVGNFQRSFATMGGTLRGFQSELGNVSRAAGNTLGRGIMTAGRGLVGFLGGPWGVAFTAAIALTALFGDSQRKAAQKVDDMAASLDQQTGAVTGATKKIIAENLLTEESFLGMETVASGIDIGKEFGLEADTLIKAAQGIPSAMDEVNSSMSKAGEGVSEWGTAIQSLKDDGGVVGGLSSMIDKFKIGYTEGDKLNQILQKQQDILDKAQAKIREVAKATGTSSANAATLSANFDTLADAASSVDEKFSALKQNLDILNGGKLSAIGAQRDQAAAYDDTGEALKNLSGKVKGSMSDLVGLNGAFKHSTDNQRTFSLEMEKSADGILKATTAVYDRVLKNTGDQGKAISAALKTATPAIEGFKQQLRDFGFEESQINGIVESLGLIPKDIVKSIRLEGSAKVKTDVLLLKAAIEAFMRGDYKASLSLIDDDVKNKISQAMGKGEEWSGKTWKAVLEALDKSGATRAEFVAAMITATETGDYTAVLDLLDLSKPKREAAEKGVKDFDKIKATAEFKAEDLTGPTKNAANNSVETFDSKEGRAKLLAEDGTQAGISKALNTLRGIDGIDFVANLKAEDAATPVLNDINNNKLSDKQSNLSADDMVSDVINQINMSPLTDKYNRMSTKDYVTDIINNINAKQLSNKLSKAQINDLASSVIDTLNAKNLNNKNSKLTTNDLVSHIINEINGTPLKGKNTELRAKDQVSSIVAAVNAKVLDNKLTKLEGKDLVSSILSVVNSKKLNDKLSNLNTKDLVSAVLGTVNSKILNDKNNTLTTRDLATAVVNAANNVVLRDKSNTITTHQVTKYSSSGSPGPSNITRAVANGGIFDGGLAQTFADGGITKALKAHAFSGGTERHIAQISRGQTPFRVWSEPETGGEAYLPLHPAKRKRSTEILRKVADMFGLGLFKQFANGGIQTKAQTGRVQSFADGGFSGSSSNSGSGSTSFIPSPGGISSELLNAIGRALARRSGSYYALGQNIVFGVVGGVNDASGDAGKAMKNLGGRIEDDFKDQMEIKSPSRKFRRLGKEVGKGLSIGLKSTTDDVRGSMNDLIKELNDASKNNDYAVKLVKNQKSISKAWARLADGKYAERMANSVQRSGRVSGASLMDYARAVETTAKRIEKAKETLERRIDTRNSFAEGISSGLKGEFDLGSMVSQTDSDGYRPPTTFSDVKRSTSTIVSRLKKFNNKLNALKKAGVSAAIIGEVAGLGSDEGIVIADALLQGSKKEIKGLNSQFKTIQNTSDKIGMKAANNIYYAGIDAQRGFIKGLNADAKALDKAADKLTNQVVARIKKNLKIKSPSRVFAEIGKFVGEGFIEGLASTQSDIDGRINRMVVAQPSQDSIVSRLNNSATTTQGSSTTSQTNSDSNSGVNVNVFPSAALDEKQVGDAAARELLFRVQNR